MKHFLSILLSLTVPLLSAHAKSPPSLTSADGTKAIHATPIDVQGSKILFRKADGSTFTAKPEVFSAEDQKKLTVWKQATLADPHRALLTAVAKEKSLRLLFIGNSYSFHCPKEFAKVCRSEGRKATVEQVTLGGWTLKKHAASEKTLTQIRDGKYHVVILQEQSQVPSFPENQRSGQMYPAAKSLAEAARKAGAIPIMFQTWGRRDGDQQNTAQFPNDTFAAMQKRLAQGYANAAAHAGKLHVMQVGMSWAKVPDDARATLYAKDGSHPSKQGNYLAACAIYSSLFNEPVKNPTSSIPKGTTTSLITASGAALYKPIPYPVK